MEIRGDLNITRTSGPIHSMSNVIGVWTNLKGQQAENWESGFQFNRGWEGVKMESQAVPAV